MRRIISLLMVAALVAGCVSSQDAQNGAIRILHAAADAPRISLYLNDRLRASGYDFTNGSAYIAVAAGAYDVRIDESLPSNADPATETIFSESVSLGINKEVTLVVAGEAAAGSEQVIQVLSVTSSVPTGKTRLQFVHAAAGRPAVDAYVIPAEDLVTASAPFEPGLSFTEHPDSQDISSGTLKIVLTEPGNPAAVWFDSGPVFFTLQGTLLIAVIPNAGPDSATRPFVVAVMSGTGSAVLQDKDTQANVRVVNVSPGSYTLDAFINETTVDNTARQTCDPLTEEDDTILELCALPFDSVGSYSTVDPGTYDVKAQKTGDAAVTAKTFAGPLVGGGRTTLVLTGLIADTATSTEVGLQTLLGARRVATAAQLRLVTLSLAAEEAIEGDPTTDRIEIYITEPGAPLDDEDPDFANFRFGSDTGYFSLVADDYQLTVTKTDTATPDVAPEVLLTQLMSLAGSGLYTLLIEDSPGGVAPLRILSIEDDLVAAP